MACSENWSECPFAAADSASLKEIPPSDGGAPEVGCPSGLELGVRLGSRTRPPLCDARSGPMRLIVVITSLLGGERPRRLLAACRHGRDVVGFDVLAADLQHQTGIVRLDDGPDDSGHGRAVDVDAGHRLADQG